MHGLRQVKHKNLPRPEPRRIRETFGLSPSSLTISAGAVVLTLWLVRRHGLAPKESFVVFCVIIGVAVFASAWKDRHERSAWVAGPLIVLMALRWLWTQVPLDVLVGGFLSVGSLAQAAIWRRRIRQLGQWG